MLSAFFLVFFISLFLFLLIFSSFSLCLHLPFSLLLVLMLSLCSIFPLLSSRSSFISSISLKLFYGLIFSGSPKPALDFFKKQFIDRLDTELFPWEIFQQTEYITLLYDTSSPSDALLARLSPSSQEAVRKGLDLVSENTRGVSNTPIMRAPSVLKDLVRLPNMLLSDLVSVTPEKLSYGLTDSLKSVAAGASYLKTLNDHGPSQVRFFKYAKKYFSSRFCDGCELLTFDFFPQTHLFLQTAEYLTGCFEIVNFFPTHDFSSRVQHHKKKNNSIQCTTFSNNLQTFLKFPDFSILQLSQ